MIISASRRTDIPAFFGDWFIARVRQGFCHRVNPYNPRQLSVCSLKPEDVDAVVFFSKNPKPFLKHLTELDERRIKYYFHFTLNDYPCWIEPGVPPAPDRWETFKALSSHTGKTRLIWRYDPIILNGKMSASYHLEKIGRIAKELAGWTERLYISFIDLYPTAVRRIDKKMPNDGETFQDWLDPAHERQRNELCQGIQKIAVDHHLEVFSCGENVDLQLYGIKHGSCVDGELIRSLFGVERMFKKDLYQRRECLCAQSVDIGNYSTCRLGCVYCYANHSEKLIERNWAMHSDDSPLLVGQGDGAVREVKSQVEIIGGEGDRGVKEPK